MSVELPEGCVLEMVDGVVHLVLPPEATIVIRTPMSIIEVNKPGEVADATRYTAIRNPVTCTTVHDNGDTEVEGTTDTRTRVTGNGSTFVESGRVQVGENVISFAGPDLPVTPW